MIFFISRYKRCPPDKILVVFGKTDSELPAKCYAGGAAFVWPVIQDYKYLDLTPINIDVNLKDALSIQNNKVSITAKFTVGVGKEPELMLAAAQRLLALNQKSIQTFAHDIILSQMSLIINNMNSEELNTNRNRFIETVNTNVEKNLNKIGLELINVSITSLREKLTVNALN